ncbi:hypothetical protein [Photobacterium leiognathi]|uniref:hypothetical protein n=1 Tax=Photobacterium leiognathi TaxID=553611 RepID=UPI00273313B3|nr:hypothetical protein [Photobacterium leiognathi]
MKIAIFSSSNTIFTYCYIKLFESIGYEVKLFNNNDEYRCNINYCVNYKKKVNSNFKRNIKKIFKIFHLTRFLNYLVDKRKKNNSLSSEELNLLSEELIKFNPDKCFFFWSTLFKSEINLISKILPQVENIISVNTYPIRSDFETFTKNKFFESDKRIFFEIQ